MVRGLGLVESAEQDGELVAAEPGHGVLGPDHGGQGARDLDQQRVAGVVTEGVVDLLEVVQVDDRDGRRRRTRPARLPRTAAARRSENNARLVSPVSGSWKARWRSRSCRLRRSVTSR